MDFSEFFLEDEPRLGLENLLEQDGDKGEELLSTRNPVPYLSTILRTECGLSAM